MKNKVYVLQGIFYQGVPSFKLQPDNIVIGKVMFFCMFHGIIVMENSEFEGEMQDHYGKSSLSNVVISGSKISFTKKYHNRYDLIYYNFEKDENDHWTGTYNGESTGKGMARLLVFEPIDEKLLEPPDNLLGNPLVSKTLYWEPGLNPSYALARSDRFNGGSSPRDCQTCYYRDGSDNSDCNHDYGGKSVKTLFGVHEEEIMPKQIDGKRVGHYCPHWRWYDWDDPKRKDNYIK
jgi:hypothetical protein